MKRAIVIAAAMTCATSVAAQDVYIVPRQEGVISRLFRMQQESDAAARQQALQNEQIELMEAQRKVLEAQARANNGTHPQMPQWMQDMGATKPPSTVLVEGRRAVRRGTPTARLGSRQ